MHNPFALVRQARKALRSASLERVPRYLEDQRESLIKWFDSETGPMSDPVIEFDPPFESAGGTWEDLVLQGYLHPKTLELLKRGGTIKSERPFLHQWKAIVEASQGKTIVVSAGTGSGKTECFLIPILDSLVREVVEGGQALVGLRSMLIYPLNALVIDQIGRWRSVLQHQNEVLGFEAIRIGMYNGHLRRDEELGADLKPVLDALRLNTKDPDLRPYLPLDKGEIKNRRDLLKGGRDGANLMITNYSMLELALLREVDQIWLNEAKAWRHIVLDEAHSYSGGLALDLTLLLRRLRDRIRPHRSPQGFATSATFGGEGIADLHAFACTMFGTEAGSVNVIQGTRIAVQDLSAQCKDDDSELKQLIAYLASQQDPERLRPLYFRTSDLRHSLFHDEGQAQERLESLLQRASVARVVNDSRALLPHRLHASLRAPMVWPSVCINSVCPGRSFSSSESTWAGLGWTGLDSSDDVCLYCNAPMLQPVTCDNEGCAREGLLGGLSTQGFPPKMNIHHPGSPGSGSKVLLTRAHHLEKDERPSDPISLTADGSCTRVDPESAQWRLFRLEDKNGILCPRCEEEGHLRPTWDGLFPRGMRDLVVLDTVMREQEAGREESEPNRGRRVLTFADSRQGAAKLAPRLSFTHRTLFVRRWILDSVAKAGPEAEDVAKIKQKIAKLRTLNDPDFEDEIAQLERSLTASFDIHALLRIMAKDTLRLTRWARSLEGTRFEKRVQDGDRLGLLAPAGEPKETIWPGLIRSREGEIVLQGLADGTPPAGGPAFEVLFKYLEGELMLALCREFFRSPGRTATILKLGLVELVWPVDSAVLPLAELGLDHEVAKSLLGALLTLAAQQGCVSPPLGISRADEDFGDAWLGRPIALQESRSEERVFSLASEKPDQRVLSAILRVAFQKASTAHEWKSWVRLAGLKLWEALLLVASDAKSPLSPLTGTDGQPRLIIDASKLRFKKAESAYRCQRCGQLSLYQAFGVCSHSRYGTASPKRGIPCGGELSGCSPWEPSNELDVAYPHARRLMLEEQAPEGLTAFEHTAQRTKDGVLRDELLFRKRQMNLLSSSTTLEMGVDLPDLDCVVLLGVPPAASNHTQRVGRAGRSRQKSSLALTLSGGDSFDRWAFRDLLAFLRRPGVTPRVDLNRPHQLARHFFAWRLGSLVSSGQLFSLGKDPSLLQRLEQFAGLDADQGMLLVDRWNASGRPAWTKRHAFPGWGDDALRVWLEVSEEELDGAARLFGRAPETLRNWLKDGAQQLEDELALIRKRDHGLTADLTDAEEKRRKFITKLQRSLRQYKTLNWLAERNILPRYGFPISTVTLQPPKALKEEGVKGGVQRDRRQAIFEWAPGSTVVVAGRVWSPERLNADVERGDKETHHRRFSLAICEKCKGTWVYDSAQTTSCGVCGSVRFQMISIAVPNGFGSKDSYKVAGSSEAPLQNGGPRILTMDEITGSLDSLVFHPAARVAFINPGGVDEQGTPLGFQIDPVRQEKFTRVLPGAKKPIDPAPVLLGEVLMTEVLRIRLPGMHSLAAFRSAGHALRLAAAFLLEVDPRSLCLSDQHPASPERVDLIDLASGGSGLLGRLMDPVRTVQWIERARDIASHAGMSGTGCVNACPECILTHDNRIEHLSSPLNRKGASKCLEDWLSSGGNS